MITICWISQLSCYSRYLVESVSYLVLIIGSLNQFPFYLSLFVWISYFVKILFVLITHLHHYDQYLFGSVTML